MFCTDLKPVVKTRKINAKFQNYLKPNAPLFIESKDRDILSLDNLKYLEPSIDIDEVITMDSSIDKNNLVEYFSALTNIESYTPHYKSKFNRLQRLNFLALQIINPNLINLQNIDGNTIFHQIRAGSLDLCRPTLNLFNLMSKVDGIDLSLKNVEGKDPLHLLCDDSINYSKFSSPDAFDKAIAYFINMINMGLKSGYFNFIENYTNIKDKLISACIDLKKALESNRRITHKATPIAYLNILISFIDVNHSYRKVEGDN